MDDERASSDTLERDKTDQLSQKFATGVKEKRFQLLICNSTLDSGG